MSLNQLLAEGKKGEGLNISIGSLAVASTVVESVFEGNVRIDGTGIGPCLLCQDDIETNNAVICEQLKLSQRIVKLNGILTAVQRQLTGEVSTMTLVGGIEDWVYQRYADVLTIQGQFVGNVINATSNSFYVEFKFPGNYATTAIGRESGVGSGANAFSNIDSQPYVLFSVRTQSPGVVRLYYMTGDGSGSRVINAQCVFMFNITLRNIVEVTPIPP